MPEQAKRKTHRTPSGPKGARRVLRRWVFLASGSVVLIIVALVGVSCLTVRIPESGSRQTVLFYAIPTGLSPGSRLDVDDLETRLRRLGYRAADTVAEPGQYRLLSGGVEVYLRSFRYPGKDFKGGRLRVRISNDQVRAVQPMSPLDIEDLRLEPERIASFEGETGAVLNPLRLSEAPPLLVDALIQVEDRRFYHHIGIDPIGTLRAIWMDLRHREVSQGGSTLTQQLARSLFLHNRKTVGRKLEEAVYALGLEMHYSKSQILEAYLNAVYWGYWGTLEIRGAREASRYYLGCDLEDADPAGIALLVGLIAAPNAYSPYASPQKARQRRDQVLRVMRDRGLLSEEQREKAAARPLPSKRPPDRATEASYFLEAARAEIEQRAPRGVLKPGTIVYTTLDPRDQAAATTALRDGLQDLEKKNRRLRRAKEPLQGAVVVVDPESGEVRALTGGRDFADSPYNRATDALRQPGSLFKPFVYLAAFLNPERKDGTYWTPATILQDEPIEIQAGRKVWRPENYDREYRGAVSLRTALEQSLNVPTAAVANEVGIKRVATAARALGIQSHLETVPSLALGTSEVTLLEITTAFAAFAANGRPHAPRFVRAVIRPSGESVPLSPLEDPPGVDAPPAWLLTRLLQGVIESGTGRSARSLGVRGPVGGKTGTTDDYRDAWFVGFSPLRATGVWVGFDRKDAVGLTGASAALPIWAEVMRQIQWDRDNGSFREPPGIVTVPIDPTTAMVAGVDCPAFRQEDFLEGTEPTKECDQHGGGIFDRLERLLGF